MGSFLKNEFQCRLFYEEWRWTYGVLRYDGNRRVRTWYSNTWVRPGQPNFRPRHDTKDHAGSSSSSIRKRDVVLANRTSVAQILWAWCQELKLCKPQKKSIVYHYSTWRRGRGNAPKSHWIPTRRKKDEACAVTLLIPSFLKDQELQADLSFQFHKLTAN